MIKKSPELFLFFYMLLGKGNHQQKILKLILIAAENYSLFSVTDEHTDRRTDEVS